MDPISVSEQTKLKAIDKKFKKGQKRVKGIVVLFGALSVNNNPLFCVLIIGIIIHAIHVD